MEEGVDRVFGIPGTHVLAVYDALRQTGSVDLVLTRLEASAGFMADACGRITGEPAVCLATAGPGVTSLLTGVAEAFVESSPVVALGGAVPLHTFGRGYYHELRDVDDQLRMMGPVTKWRGRAEAVDQVPGLVARAFTEVRRDRPRPVFLELPKDVMEEEGEGVPRPSERPLRKAPSPSAVQEALDLLGEADRPLVLAGGGVPISGAWEEVRQVAERLGAPVATTVTGKGSLPADHPLFLGLGAGLLAPEEVREALVAMDLLLALGTRFDEIGAGGWTLPAPERIIQVNVDPEDLNRVYEASVAVEGDVRRVLEALLEGLPATPRDPWHVPAPAEEAAEGPGNALTLGGAVRALREALPREALVTCDSGNSQVAMFDFPVYEPRTYLSPTGFNAMGFALPAALGAQIVRPDRPVAAVFGDGALLMNGMELLTAVERDLPVAFFLFNDGGYGILRLYQDLMFDGRRTAVDVPRLDVDALARSVGLECVTVRSAREAPGRFREAVDADAPVLVDVRIDPDSKPPPLVRAYGLR